MCLGGEAALNQLWYVWGQCIGGYCCCPDTERNLVKQEILRTSTKDINIINCKMFYFWNYPSNLFDQQSQRAVPSTTHYKWRKWQSRYCPIWCHGLINKQQIRSLSSVGDSIKCHVGWGATTPAQWGDGNNKMLSRHNLQIMSLVPNSEIMSSIVKWINTICALNTECLLRLKIEYLSKVCSECWQCDKSKPKPTHIQHSVIWCHTLPYSYTSEHQIFVQWHMHRLLT